MHARPVCICKYICSVNRECQLTKYISSLDVASSPGHGGQGEWPGDEASLDVTTYSNATECESSSLEPRLQFGTKIIN